MSCELTDSAYGTAEPGLIEGSGNSVAMQCLQAAVQASGLPQKALAGSRSVPQFNKLLNGVQAFGLALLDELPTTVRDDFMSRYADACGLEVRAKNPAEIAEELLALIDRAAQLSRLARLGRPRAAKAGLPATAGKRRVG